MSEDIGGDEDRTSDDARVTPPDRTGKVVTNDVLGPHFFYERCIEDDCQPVSDKEAVEFIWSNGQGLRWKAESDKPFCCVLTCNLDAEFDIYGESNHPDDTTQACELHVGELLGTPMYRAQTSDGEPLDWTAPQNQSWTVVTLASP